LPAIASSRHSAAQTACQSNARNLTVANINYAVDHGRTAPDMRAPAYERLPDGGRRLWRDGQAAFRTVINSVEGRRQSWFGQLENRYLGGDLSRVDCPVIDNHRWHGYDNRTGKWAWPVDYSVNKFGVNMALDMADDPGRNVMFGEPNMHRPQISFLVEVVAFYVWWGENPASRSDLEQIKAGSVSYGFVDGHAARVRVPKVPIPFLEAYPELSLSAGSPPPTSSSGAYLNYFWWNPNQVQDPHKRNVAHFPPANDWTPGPELPRD
jgi:hypothetical protein